MTRQPALFCTSRPVQKIRSIGGIDIYKERKIHYDNVAAALDLNIKLPAFLLITALSGLSRKKEEMTKGIVLPVLNIPISTEWVYVIIPIALEYLWLQFGFLLDIAIDSRKALATIIGKMEILSVSSFYSTCNVLEDRGFLDRWFMVNDN